MTIEQERKRVEMLFDKYESAGFAKTFGTPYEGERKYVGMEFKVIGRVKDIAEDKENGADLECLPMWHIRFDNGEEMAAYPEEICLLERRTS